MQMSTLAAGARTRGISTVCWHTALSFPVLLENAQNADKGCFFCVLSKREKTFPPSVVFLNRKLYACNAQCDSRAPQCLFFPTDWTAALGAGGLLLQKQMVAHQKVASGLELVIRVEFRVISNGIAAAVFLLVWF